MDTQYQVLSYLVKGPDISQRQIAEGTGLSIATVNVLLKKMVRKGLVKLERVNGRSLRYILTPHGLAEKSRLAYQYLKNSYQQIIRVTQVLREVVEEARAQGSVDEIMFLGASDEVLEMLKVAAENLGLRYSLAPGFPAALSADQDRCVILVWQPGVQEEISGRHVINILDRL